MADEIRLVTYANQQVTPQNDAVLTNLEILNNGIIFGCEVTIKNASTLHINSGMGVIYGREFEIVDSDISVPLPGAGTEVGQLYIHIDLANTSEPIQILVETGASLTPMVDDANLNVTTGITEYQLATFNVSAATISDLVVTSTEVDGLQEATGHLQEEIDDINDSIRTNLLNPTAQTQTVRGVTFTNNGDGTYTVNGTATDNVFFDICNVTANGTFKITGCPVGGSALKYEFCIITSDAVSFIARDFGNGINFDETMSNAIARIVVRNGYTANNLLFKPMLTTDLNAKYDDYVPYTGDSGRLNEDVSNKQNKTDNSLATSDKTIVGAINEINNDISEIDSHLPIYGTAKGQGAIQNALNVDLTNVDGLVNRVGYVYSGYTSSLPSDCRQGIREVFYYAPTHVLIKITGINIHDKYAEWGNAYVDTTWTGWVSL